MRAGGHWRWVPREVFLSLALVALTMQVLVPPGYMVGGHDGGPARIVICTGHGPVEAAVDLGGKSTPSHGKSSDAPCAFAAHAAPANLAPADPAIAIAWTPLETVRATPSDQVTIGRGLAAPPPARGPPLS
jgi:hypothetical protein